MAVMDTEPRILVVRPDRIGDVILSTPVFAAIKKNFPQSYVAAVVRSEVAPLIRGLEVIDEVIVYDRQGMHAGLKGLWKFVHELRSREFRISIVLQTHWKVALAIWLAKIRFRVGPLGKVHSYLFYNHGIRQRRSQVEMHEADYNLQLLSPLGIQNTTHTFSTQVRVSELAKRKAKDWLTAQG